MPERNPRRPVLCRLSLNSVNAEWGIHWTRSEHWVSLWPCKIGVYCMDLGFFLKRQQFWDTLKELLASAKQKVLLFIKKNPEPAIDTSQLRFFFKYTQRTVTPKYEWVYTRAFLDSEIWTWGTGWTDMGWEGRGGCSAVWNVWLWFQEVFNTAQVFQNGLCGSNRRGIIMMWQQGIFMRATDNGILSLKTLNRPEYASRSMLRLPLPALTGGACASAQEGHACLGERSAESIWFPAFNQVTQAWNAQLCQTQSVWDGWETTACQGDWCEERPWSPFSLLWMAALTSQQIGTTGGTNNKAQAKSTLFCCGAILISSWYLLCLWGVSLSRGEWLELKNKGSLWADKAALCSVPIIVLKKPGYTIAPALNLFLTEQTSQGIPAVILLMAQTAVLAPKS